MHYRSKQNLEILVERATVLSHFPFMTFHIFLSTLHYLFARFATFGRKRSADFVLRAADYLDIGGNSIRGNKIPSLCVHLSGKVRLRDRRRDRFRESADRSIQKYKSLATQILGDLASTVRERSLSAYGVRRIFPLYSYSFFLSSFSLAETRFLDPFKGLIGNRSCRTDCDVSLCTNCTNGLFGVSRRLSRI